MSRTHLAAALALLVLTSVIGAKPAFAHAVLLESAPSTEAVLNTSPAEVRLGFNENVGPIFVKVLDASGNESGNPDAFRVEGNDVYLPLREPLENGTYVVAYRVISADTHPVGGSVLFAVGEPIADVGEIADAGSVASGWRAPVAANRFLLYVAGALSAGSALLLVILQLPAAIADIVRTQGRMSSVVAGIALPLAIGLGGAEMQAGGVGALFSGKSWITGIGSTLGSSAMIGVPGCIVLWLTFRKRAPGAGMLLAGTALVLGSFLVTGHAATAAPAWAMAFVVAIHLVAVAFWFAALWPLKHAVGTLNASDAVALLEQFSGRAILAVTSLAITGGVITWVQVQSLAAFTTTDYGVRLLIKIALVVAIVGLAALNKQRLTGRLRDDAAGAAPALLRSIRAEYLLMLAIMAVAVSLTLPSPPRALLATDNAAMTTASAFTTETSKDGVTVSVEVTPARTGENMVMLSFSDADGNPMPMQRVRISLSLPSASLEGVEREGETMAPGMYHFMLNEFIIPGEWEVRIDAFVDDFDKKILRVSVPIR